MEPKQETPALELDSPLPPTAKDVDVDTIDNVEEIEFMQKSLSSNYKTLAKEFSRSRIGRVDAYIEKLTELQQDIKKKRNQYEAALAESIPALDTETSAELPSLDQVRSLKRKRFDTTVQDTDNTSPPPGSPTLDAANMLDEMPVFTEPFEHLLAPYRERLQACKNKFELQSENIEVMTSRNVGLIWRQSVRDRQEAREALRKQVVKELQALDDDYYNVCKNEKVNLMEERYRAASRKAGERKQKSDLAIIAEEVKSRVDASAPAVLTDAASVAQRGTPMTKASSSEIDNDLAMMRAGTAANVRIEKVEANYVYMEQPLKKGVFGPPTMTDMVNNEIEAGMAYYQIGQYPPGPFPPGPPGMPPMHPEHFQQQQQQPYQNYQQFPPPPPPQGAMQPPYGQYYQQQQQPPQPPFANYYNGQPGNENTLPPQGSFKNK